VTFASLGLPTPILKGIRATGHIEPTAIQSKSIPVTLEGNDLIAAVQSGSGKTAAYLLPVLARLLDSSTRLRAIVLVPTRELAAYVETRARDYARFANLSIGVVFTGAPLSAQEKHLRENPVDLLVATPGRLLELHAKGCLNFDDVELLVFDEADRMVALGLAPDLRKLLKVLPETRQTLMFSMTMPPELNRLAKDALIEPVRVDLGPSSKPTAGITQAIYPVRKELKPDLLDEMLSRTEVRSTVVLTRTRHAAIRLARMLTRRFTVAVLDEHPNHTEREQALMDLRRGRVQILVASATSGRSLDFANLAHVVNFDVPQVPEDYVHRLGRAGRGEPVGDVFTLMSPEEQREVAAVERFLGRTVPRVLLPDFDYDGKPREVKTVVSYGDEFADEPRRGGAGLQAATQRITAVKRPAATATPATPAPNGTPKSVPAAAAPAAKRSRPAVQRHRPAGAKPAASGAARRSRPAPKKAIKKK
jgi:ATP-dependent RNA helicase RhlE